MPNDCDFLQPSANNCLNNLLLLLKSGIQIYDGERRAKEFFPGNHQSA